MRDILYTRQSSFSGGPTSAEPHWQAGTVHALHLFPFFASLTQHPPTDPPTHQTYPHLDDATKRELYQG